MDTGPSTLIWLWILTSVCISLADKAQMWRRIQTVCRRLKRISTGLSVWLATRYMIAGSTSTHQAVCYQTLNRSSDAFGCASAKPIFFAHLGRQPFLYEAPAKLEDTWSTILFFCYSKMYSMTIRPATQDDYDTCLNQIHNKTLNARNIIMRQIIEFLGVNGTASQFPDINFV